jgi:hypothetical protein
MHEADVSQAGTVHQQPSWSCRRHLAARLSLRPKAISITIRGTVNSLQVQPQHLLTLTSSVTVGLLFVAGPAPALKA